MIHHLSLLLRRLFEKNAGLGLQPGQTGFEPPDENWRKYVAGLQQHALNIYLADLRENHHLRSNELWHEVRNGDVYQLPSLRWLDCHYLISAWDPVAPDIAHGVEPMLTEQAMLALVASLLLELETGALTPRQIYAPQPLPADFPPELADAALPVTMLPGEGFPKLAEFWGTMGAGYRWKPVVYLIATLPVIRQAGPVGPPVTSVVSHYGQEYGKKTEVHIQISGNVLDTQHPLPDNTPPPLEGAVVKLETANGKLLQETCSNERGIFIFTGLRAGSYQLQVKAEGIGEKTCPIEVRTDPQGTGVIDYDVHF